MITYVIQGHETAKCWQDDDDMKRVFGPYEDLVQTENFDEVVPAIINYFIENRATPDDVSRFVTVTEMTPEGDNRGQKHFTAADFLRNIPPGLKERNATIVSGLLVANGLGLGRSKSKL